MTHDLTVPKRKQYSRSTMLVVHASISTENIKHKAACGTDATWLGYECKDNSDVYLREYIDRTLVITYFPTQNRFSYTAFLKIFIVGCLDEVTGEQLN
jgi:hypothetical protein